MAEEFSRKQYGETPDGAVVVIGFRGGFDAGAYGVMRYEVRKGNHTIASFPDEAAADALAAALVPAVDAVPTEG